MRDRHGDDFFRFDSGSNCENRFVILFSKFKSKHFKNIKTLILDGTFKAVPSSFFQVLVLHGLIFGKSYPIVYVLLSNKLEKSYKNALQKVVELTEIDPKFCVMDFERGIINAVISIFPNSNVNGCAFHLGLSVWRRIVSSGLSKTYKTNDNFKKYVNFMLCLSFVPVIKVREYYLVLKKKIYFEKINELFQICDYFERVYVGVIDQ
jgi:hypothetical protein